MDFRNIQRVLTSHPSWKLVMESLPDGRFIVDIRTDTLGFANKGCAIAETPVAALFLLNVRLIEHTPVLAEVFDENHQR